MEEREPEVEPQFIDWCEGLDLPKWVAQADCDARYISYSFFPLIASFFFLSYSSLPLLGFISSISCSSFFPFLALHFYHLGWYFVSLFLLSTSLYGVVFALQWYLFPFIMYISMLGGITCNVISSNFMLLIWALISINYEDKLVFIKLLNMV